MKKKPYKKYSLIREQRKDKQYTSYIIKDLKFIPICEDRYDFEGACALLKDPNHQGYCSLCNVYRKDGDSSVFGELGTTIHFEPLYNDQKQRILVKYNKDEVFAIIDATRETWDKPRGDYKLTILNYGAVDLWSREENKNKEGN